MKSVYEHLTKQKGIYVAVKHKGASIDSLKKKLNITNPHEDYHCTLIYSKQYDNVEVNPKTTYNASVVGLHAFSDTFLVCVLDCPELVARHKELMSTYNLVYDYDEYIPHITLSYDINKEEKFDKSVLELSKEDFKKQYGKITVKLCCEYKEDLNEDYAKE